MTASLGDERAFTDVTIIPTGVAGTSGIGTATVQLLTNVAVTGIGLTGSLRRCKSGWTCLCLPRWHWINSYGCWRLSFCLGSSR